MEKEKINAKRKSPFTDIFLDLIDGMTQQQVADKVGVSRQNVGLWIKGATVPDIFTLPKIAEAFNVSTDYLLGRTETPSIKEDIQIAIKTTGLTEEIIEKIKSIKSKLLKNILEKAIYVYSDEQFLKGVAKHYKEMYLYEIFDRECFLEFAKLKKVKIDTDHFHKSGFYFNDEKYFDFRDKYEYYDFRSKLSKEMLFGIIEDEEYEKYKYEKLLRIKINEFNDENCDLIDWLGIADDYIENLFKAYRSEADKAAKQFIYYNELFGMESVFDIMLRGNIEENSAKAGD